MHKASVPACRLHLGAPIGVPLDVDLITLRSRGVVRILVAMVPKALERQVDLGHIFAVACAVKVFDFVFHREPTDFVADPSFAPFFSGDGRMMMWMKRTWATNKDHAISGPSGASTSSEVSNMDVDTSLPPSSANKGKSVAASHVFCSVITSYNANPRTRILNVTDKPRSTPT
jgi:hypothetical protein